MIRGSEAELFMSEAKRIWLFERALIEWKINAVNEIYALKGSGFDMKMLEIKYNLCLIKNSLFITKEEREFWEVMRDVALHYKNICSCLEYIKEVSTLTPYLEAFIDNTLINHEDPEIKNNRLLLLQTFSLLSNFICDLKILSYKIAIKGI